MIIYLVCGTGAQIQDLTQARQALHHWNVPSLEEHTHAVAVYYSGSDSTEAWPF